ncbi:MAG TPA: hypothetical protein VMH05_03095 [Bryobacteraceae bacterium]|nr:hypothetical protein [Bryobacteraceae bacterium]
MKDLSDLLDDLSDAINQALWRSGGFLDAAAALQEAAGDFRISVDVVLPQAADPHSSARPVAVDPTESDVEFLRSLKVKI